MERDKEQQPLVDLGAASEETLGAEGISTDFVRDLPKNGISDE